MMAQPLGFRVSGLFRMNSPIKIEYSSSKKNIRNYNEHLSKIDANINVRDLGVRVFP